MMIDFPAEPIEFEAAAPGDLLCIVDQGAVEFGMKVITTQRRETGLLPLREWTRGAAILGPQHIGSKTTLRFPEARVVPALEGWKSTRDATPEHADILISADSAYFVYGNSESGGGLAALSDGVILFGRYPLGVIIRGWSIEVGERAHAWVLTVRSIGTPGERTHG